MKKYILTCTLCLMAISCSRNLPEISIERDTTFTGRANKSEKILDIIIKPQEKIKLGYISLEIEGTAAVEKIHALSGGEVLGSIDIKGDKTRYRIPVRKNLTDSVCITVAADIKADAVEGSRISADITSMTFSGRKSAMENPAPGYREVLLCRTRLFAPGDYGSTNFRIPAICTLQDGTLLTTTDKRKFNEGDLPQDIDILVRHSSDGGHTWSEPITIAEGQGVGKGFGDAALVAASDGTVITGFVGGPGTWRSNMDDPLRSFIRTSTDGGRTWSEPSDLTWSLWGPKAVNRECRTSHSAFFGSGHGLLIQNGPYKGRIMFVSAVLSKENRFDDYAVYSDDNGATWKVSSRAYRGGDEAKVVELNDGRLLMSVRQTGERGFNISEDGGATWGEQGRWPEICTNACDGDIIRFDENTLLQSVPNSMKRENVTIFLSHDEGKSWPEHASICPYESVYSSLTLLPDGTIGAYIEENPSGACEMWFMNFSMEWLKKHMVSSKK